MRFDLAKMIKRRKRTVTIRPFRSTKAQADDLAAIYARMLVPMWEIVKPLADLYARELDRKLQTDSIDELGATIDAMGEAIKRLVLTLTPDLRDWALRMESVQRGHWVRSVLSATDIDLSTMLGPQDVAEDVGSFLQRNAALVRDVSEQARGRIADAVYRGFQSRTTAREVAKVIAEAVDMGRARARRIAADQSNKLAAALNEERQRQAGVDVFKWVHSGKAHPRSWHKVRNGKLYELNTGKGVTFDNGEKSYTGEVIEAGDRPGQAPFCGCTAQGVLILDGEVLG